MESELMTLAASASTAVVGLLAEDAWTATKDRVVALFRRSRTDTASVEAELEQSHRDLVAARESADGTVPDDVETLWRMRLRYLLREDPGAAEELRSLIADATAQNAPPAPVHNSITDTEVHGSVIQAGSIEGGVNIGGRRRGRLS